MHKPIFLVGHTRSRSTAFERAFFTRRDTLTCLFEPFGEPYYLGPERCNGQYEDVVDTTQYESETFRETLEKTMALAEREANNGRRLFLKDMVRFIVKPPQAATKTVPSFPFDVRKETIRGIRNPSFLPTSELSKFHFTFILRDPCLSVPSLYRLTLPSLRGKSRLCTVNDGEIGYEQMRKLFDYLRAARLIGPRVAQCEAQRSETSSDSESSREDERPLDVEICIVDAEDLLKDPERILRAYCKSVGVGFDPCMLEWDSESDHDFASQKIHHWEGFRSAFHEQVLSSQSFLPPTEGLDRSIDDYEQEWLVKYGKEGADTISELVRSQWPHYQYLKQFALKLD